MTDWTAEGEQTLRDAYARGDSYGIIGATLRITRSAVAGKVRRLGLSRALGQTRRSLPTNPSWKTRPAKYRKSKAPQVPVEPVAPPRAVIPGRECDVWTIDKTRCKFPHGEPRKEGFHFCGQPPQEGSPYCRDHHVITHRKTPVMA